MGKVLILAEKHSLAKKIAEAIDVKIKKKGKFFENNDIVVANLVGHVIQPIIPKNSWDMDKLPFNYENLKLEPKSDKKELVNELIKTMNREDIVEIVSAGDPDAEGSLLVKELIDYSQISSKRKEIKFTRMWILSYDKKAISDAYKNRYDLVKDKPWSDAAEARTYSDLDIGYNLSPFFSLLHNGEYAIGRVMTPTTNLVRKRELDIENFVPEHLFFIVGVFNKDNIDFNTKYLCSENNNTEKIPEKNIKEVEQNKLIDKKFKVTENKTKPKKTNPDFLPNLNDVLKAMSKRYKMKAKTVTKDMQFLYENQFCSYPRSEQKFLPPDMASTFEEIFNNYNNNEDFSNCDAVFSGTNKRIFDAEKSNPHYAITPLSKTENEINSLTASQKKIFDYILGQFMMAFMPPYQYEETIILLENSKGAKFKISGKVEKEKGFKKYKSSNTTKKEKEVVLPSVKEGEELELKRYEKDDKWTEPPKLLTEGELLSYMENINKIYMSEIEENEEENEEEIFKEKFSLGTPATRGPTLEKLYLKKEGREPLLILNKDNRIETTSRSRKILEAAGDLINIEITAKFEKRMFLITEGKESGEEFKKDIHKFVKDIIDNNKGNYVPKVKAEKTGKNCPKCGKELLKRTTKDNKVFLGCSGYPNCKHAEWQQEKVGRECPKCGGELIYRTTKDNKKFISCSNYPNCKHAEWPQEKVGRKCPTCDSDLIYRKMKDGRQFIACSSNDCKYVEWPQEKVGRKCPTCDSDLIYRKMKDGRQFIACSSNDCKYVEWPDKK